MSSEMCSELYIFASILPWFSPVLNAFLYSFIGKRFRTNLTRLFQSDKTIRRRKLAPNFSTRISSFETVENENQLVINKMLNTPGGTPTAGTRCSHLSTPINTARYFFHSVLSSIYFTSNNNHFIHPMSLI